MGLPGSRRSRGGSRARRCSAAPTGSIAIRALIPRVRQGRLALEVGEGQAEEVAELLRGAGFAEIRTRRDLAGIERVVVGERRL